jgi:hypothetical protein
MLAAVVFAWVNLVGVLFTLCDPRAFDLERFGAFVIDRRAHSEAEREVNGTLIPSLDWRNSFSSQMSFVRVMTRLDADNVEKWVTVLGGLYTCNSLVTASALLLTHFKSYCSKSLAVQLTDYCTRVIFADAEPEPQSMLDFVSVMKSGLSDWKKLKTSPLFVRITDIVGLLVSSGMCTTINLDFSLAGVPLFSKNLRERLDNANIVDTAQMVVEAITYFIEVGYTCFTQRSLRPILFTDIEAANFDAKYMNFIRVHPMMMDGDWEGAGMDDDAYLDLYEDVYSYMKSVYATLSRCPEKHLMWNKMVGLVRMKNDFERKLRSGALRMAPYCLAVTGPSSVGKSSVGVILNMVCVKACGGSGDQQYKYVHNDGDKFQTGLFSNSETVVLDDLCNTNSNFVDVSPLSWIIKYNNNNPEVALKADVDSKGKTIVAPLTLLITSNVEDFQANVYSNEPTSILRRVNVRIKVKVRPAFGMDNGSSGARMLDPAKAVSFVQSLPIEERQFPDMWDLTLERCVSDKNPTLGGKDIPRFVPVVHNGVTLENVSLLDAADFLALDAHAHHVSQKAFIATQAVMHEQVHLCSDCHSVSLRCKCVKNYREQSGEDVAGSFPDISLEEAVPDQFTRDQLTVASFSDLMRGCALYGHMLSRNVAMWMGTVAVWIAYGTLNCYSFFVPYSAATCVVTALWSCVLASMCLTRAYVNFYFVRRRFGHFLLGRRGVMQRFGVHTPFFRVVVGSGVLVLSSLWVVSAMRGILKIWKTWHKLHVDPQSALNPTLEEYDVRRSEVNPWMNNVPKTRLKDYTKKSSTTDHRALSALIQKNMVYIQDGSRFVGGFFLCTHLLILPKHFMKDDIDITVTSRVSVGRNHHNYRARLSVATTYYISGTDLCVSYCAGGCERVDLWDYFPAIRPEGSSVCSFGFRGKDGRVITDTVRVSFQQVTTLIDSYYGALYEFSFNTFKGLCMGAFVSETKSPHIVGFHLAGETGTPKGCLGVVTRSQLAGAKAFFSSLPGIFASGECADIPTIAFEQHLGEQPFMLEASIAPRCPTQHLDETASILVHGACTGGATYRSNIIPSHISDSVTKHLGVPRKHGPPPMGPPRVPPWHIWSVCMDGFSHPSIGPAPDVLVMAAADYLSSVLALYDTPMKPLDMATIVNGIDNDRFVNRMPTNTAIGFPMRGPLSKVLSAGPSLPSHMVNMVLDPDIVGEFEVAEARYLEGYRCYFPFKASPKDEGTKLDATKTRIFQAAPLILKMILRKYYLPIVSQLSMFPLLSECAVGINAFNAEWGEMMEHIETFGTNRIIAGDYSAYDQRMSPSLSSAAFDILIECAIRAGYSTDDLKIMRAVACDVIYPVVAFNGTLVQMCGGNPSGHNITVYVNSIVNSLINRCAFFSICGYKKFGDHVRLMTYGDDDIGSVDCSCSAFNNVSKAAYINSIGMKYTPPSKEGEHQEYLELQDVDFLKRKDRYVEALGRRVGVLEEGSIFKSLHVRLPSPELSDEEWAGSVVDGALREFAPRGEDYYESIRERLRSVAVDCDFLAHSVNLACTFAEMTEKISS